MDTKELTKVETELETKATAQLQKEVEEELRNTQETKSVAELINDNK